MVQQQVSNDQELEKFLQKYLKNRMILIVDSPFVDGDVPRRSPTNGEFMYSSNKLRVTLWTFPYAVYWVSYVAQTRQDIEKRFSASLKGVENEAHYPSKISHLKFSFLSLAKCAIFSIFKSCFIIFIDVWSLCY